MRPSSAALLAGPHLPRGPATLFLEHFAEDAINVVEYPPGQLPFQGGDEARRVHLLLEGRIGLYGAARRPRTFLGLASIGEILDPAAIFSTHHTVAAAALECCRLATIAKCDIVSGLMRNGPALAVLIDQLVRRTQALEQHIMWCRLPSHVHLARLLLDLSSAEIGETLVSLPFSRTILAGWLGIQPESLCRAFAKLRPLGVRARGPAVTIRDLGALRAIVEESPQMVR